MSSGILASTRQGSATVLLTSGNIMIMGGDLDTSSYETHTQTGTLVSTGTLFNTFNGGANVVNNGNIYILGCACCSRFSGSSSTWEIRTAAGAFVSTGSLFNPR